VLTIWRDEFDRAYAEGGPFQLTMHPHVIGPRSRITVLEELIDHISSRANVWYATQAGMPPGCPLTDRASRSVGGA
jgi:peptidoglycan-N-acetylglucosamine deacetylase